MKTWRKRGLILTPDQIQSFTTTHTQLPVVAKGGSDDRKYVFFSVRDEQNRSLPFVAELVNHGSELGLKLLTKKPLLAPGLPGTFDDAGVMPTSAIWVKDKIWVYYIGWNTRGTVPYQNAVGLAVFDPESCTLKRMFEGAILDRTKDEPYFVGTMDVCLNDGKWMAWYLSCTGWTSISDKWEPRYLIRFASSVDGILWKRDGTISIPYESDNEAIAAASVLKNGAIYEAYYCVRSIMNYRSNPNNGYRIQYAKSGDGRVFERISNGITGMAEGLADWEDKMQAYPCVFNWQGKTYMLYNGNGFGASGIGYAELID